jgi:hypothetical protein
MARLNKVLSKELLGKADKKGVLVHLIETHFPGATPHVDDQETQEESSSLPLYDKWMEIDKLLMKKV